MRRVLVTFGALALLMACDGQGAVGDSCTGGAAENDCVDGALCTLARSESVAPPSDPNNEQFFCRAICDVDSNCDTGFSCRQAPGSMTRTCQPTDEAAGDADAGM